MSSDPKISANALAEFLTATLVRKEGIVRQARDEDSPAGVRYARARTAIASFLTDPRRPMATLQKAIAQLRDAANRAEATIEPGKRRSFAVSDANLSADAVEIFMRMQNELPFSGLSTLASDTRPPRIEIEGVLVSVRPDVLICRQAKDGSEQSGGVLMYFSKGEDSESAIKASERKERSLCSAALVYRYAEEHLQYIGAPSCKICFALDIFGRKLYEAPDSRKRRMENIEAGCRLIKLMWDAV